MILPCHERGSRACFKLARVQVGFKIFLSGFLLVGVPLPCFHLREGRYAAKFQSDFGVNPG